MRILHISSVVRARQAALLPLIDGTGPSHSRHLLRTAKPGLYATRIPLTYEDCCLSRTYKQGVYLIQCKRADYLSDILEDIRLYEFQLDHGMPLDKRAPV